MTDNCEADDYMQRLNTWKDSPAAMAEIEQAQAQFVDDIYVVMTFTHAAALAHLRGNHYVQALASQQLGAVIRDMDSQRIRLLVMKMASSIAVYEADMRSEGDLERSIAAIGGPQDFMRLEAYIATNGDLCLFCGVSTLTDNDGIAHTCKDGDDVDL